MQMCDDEKMNWREWTQTAKKYALEASPLKVWDKAQHEVTKEEDSIIQFKAESFRQG